MALALKLLVSAIFLGLAAYEVHRDLIARAPWPGYSPAGNLVVYVHVPLWLLGAVCVWLRRDRAWPWLCVIAGALSLLAHGIGTLVGGSLLGAAFLVAGPVVLVLALLGRRRSPRPVEARAREPEPAAAAR